MQKKLAASSLCVAALAMGIIAIVGGVIRAEENQDRYLGVTDPVQDKPPFIRYGVTLVHLQDDFWKGMAYGMVDETKRVGGKVVQVSIAGKFGNMAEQYAQIEAMMTKGIDVLVLGPSAYDGFDPMLKKVKEKGITVIAAGIPLGSKLTDYGVVMSDFDIGKRMGDALCQHRPKDKQTFKTLALPGPAGAEWTKLRVDGLLESAKSCPGEEVVVAPVGGEISIGYALATTSDMITKNPDASFVWAPAGGLGMGAIQGVRQRHANMQVVSSNIVRPVFAALDDGTLLGVNTEPAILMGRLMVQYSIRRKLGLPTPLIKEDKGFTYPVVITPTRIITKDNYKGYPWQETDVPPEDWSIDAFQ
jgi:ABC-type sugar transport system substrate-binding protein